MKKCFWVFSVCAFAASSALANLIVPKAKSHYKIEWAELAEIPDAVGPLWGEFRSNLELLGYKAEKINLEIIPSIENRFSTVVSTAAEALGMSDWDYERKLKGSDYRKLANDPICQEIVAGLGFWLEIENFNSEKFLDAVFSSLGNVAGEAMTYLLGWSHLWLDSERGLKRALEILKQDEPWPLLPWVLDRLKGADRETLGEKIKEFLQLQVERVRGLPLAEEALFLMQVSARIPEKYQPSGFKRRLARMGWNGNGRNAPYPALVTDNIELLHCGSHYAGNCQNMSWGHLQTLGIAKPRSNDWKNSIVISVQGQIVGALKLVGDSSMVALRNVRNSDGKQVLSIGGVYHLPLDLVANLPERVLQNSKWLGVNLDHLSVKPADFLLNASAWPNIPEHYWTRLLGIKEAEIQGMENENLKLRATQAVLENLNCARLLLQQQMVGY
jgi:hypothetical protein